MNKNNFTVELEGLTKVFGNVIANDGISLRIEPGTIHGIIGENGAGKSTAMKMLYGIYRPDSGKIRVYGQERHWRTPHDAIEAGIGMVHQHFMLAGPISALDNILLGAEPLQFGWVGQFEMIDRKSARQELNQLAKNYGLPVELDSPVETLPVGIQQRIEILKLLYRKAKILILDEPTAVLTPQETTELFRNLSKLRDEGKSILIITHKLKEVMSVTDKVTVFRTGKVTGERKTSETSIEELAELMVGRKVNLRVDAPPPSKAQGKVLEITGLNLGRVLSNISFSIRGGEIVGIAGVEGNGQSQLLQAVLHPSEPECRSAGLIKIFGHDVTNWTTDQIKDLGVGIIPEDRHEEGLLLERPVIENFILGLHRKTAFNRFGFLNQVNASETAKRAIDRYDVRPRSLSIKAGGLSGGNQQKLVIAREFESSPRLLIAAQPTRGVDVGAIEFIHKEILRARSEGAGVLLVSSELDEILTLSDRILVIYGGKIIAQFNRGEADERQLGMFMGGGAVQ